MWTCPKCHRDFKNTEQSHYCGKPENVDDYLATQTTEVQNILTELRGVIKTVSPEITETIKWGMPYFVVDKADLCGFAAQKKHISFFPGEQVVAEFASALAAYHATKGTVHLPYDRPLDGELIVTMLQWKLAKR